MVSRRTMLAMIAIAVLAAACTSEEHASDQSSFNPSKTQSTPIAVQTPRAVAPGKEKAAEQVSAAAESFLSIQAALASRGDNPDLVRSLKALEGKADIIYQSLPASSKTKYDTKVQDFREATQELTRAVESSDTKTLEALQEHLIKNVLPGLNTMLSEVDQ